MAHLAQLGGEALQFLWRRRRFEQFEIGQLGFLAGGLGPHFARKIGGANIEGSCWHAAVSALAPWGIAA
jgi:hypothetical protein